MLDLQQIQTLAQLIDNIDVSIEKLEKSYKNNDAEEFQNSKKEILTTQDKISDILKKTLEEK